MRVEGSKELAALPLNPCSFDYSQGEGAVWRNLGHRSRGEAGGGQWPGLVHAPAFGALAAGRNLSTVPRAVLTLLERAP